MDFELKPPTELNFNNSAGELVSKLSNHRSKQNELVLGYGDRPIVIHIGNIVVRGEELEIRFCEKENEIQETAITRLTKNDSFLGTPLKQDLEDFLAFLDRKSISWSRPDDETICLWEDWLVFHIEDDVIEQLVWINPDSVSEMELIEMAFPSRK